MIPTIGISGGGGGSSGGSGGVGGGGQAHGTKVTNPNWDPRFKPDTTLGVKIQGAKMLDIMSKSNFDGQACVRCDKQGNERRLTYHAKGSCQTCCKHASNHKKLSDAVVPVMFIYITIYTVRGKGDLHPDITNIPHPAAHLLSHFQKVETPAIMSGAPWTEVQIESALRRGPHSSSKHGIEFL